MTDQPGGMPARFGSGRRHSTAAEQFTTALKKMLKVRGWGQDDLAAAAYLSPSLVSKIIRGINPPTVRAAEAMDVAFGTAPAFASLAVAARNEPYLGLPPSPQFFVGRDSQLARLDGVASGMTADSKPTVIMVAGLGGIGKTHLVLHWANTMADEFAVVLWANLRGYSGDGGPAAPGEILADLLRGLGVQHIPPSDDRRLKNLRGHLQERGQRVLIVLDNARRLAQVRPVLPQSPGTLVVVTSRQQILGFAQENTTVHIPLREMGESDSAKLIGEVIEPDRAAEEPAAVARLVSLCAKLPLALIMASVHVAADRTKTVQEHADELAEKGRERLLSGGPGADGDDGVVGVRATFDWSYDLLDADQARMFRLLGAHPGAKFRIGAAAALAGITETAAAMIVDDLVQAHLVQLQKLYYYRMHDLLRVYAAEKFAEAPEHEQSAAVARLTRWYTHGANAAAWALMPGRDHHTRLGPPPVGVEPPEFPTAEHALNWCAAEMPNITPVAQLAYDHQLWFDAWRMPTDLIDYHILGRSAHTWQTSMQIAYRAAEVVGEDLWTAEAADKLGEVFRRVRDYDTAERYDRRALELSAPLSPPPPRLGWAFVGLGNTAHARGEFDAAVDLIGRGVEAFVSAGYSIGSNIGELTGRIHWGRALRAVGDRTGALEQGRRALEGFRTNEDQHGIATALTPLARTAYFFGDLRDALRYSDEAQSLFHAVGDPWGEAEALGIKGPVLNTLGRRDEALRCLHTAVTLIETLDEVKAAQLCADIDAIDSGDST